MGDLLLRACEPEDLDQVARLEAVSFPERPYTRRDFAYYVPVAGDGFVVASKDGRVLGYVVAMANGREGWIQSIAVEPGSRRKGLGEALMSRALEHLRGVELVSLLVSSRNVGAIRLYRKLGFEETGRVVPSYYPDGSDALEMTRRP